MGVLVNKMSDKRNDSHIIFISGASGAGKTTLLKKLAAQLPSASTSIFHFDSIGVPTIDEMIKHYGSPREWQRAMTDRWVEKLVIENTDKSLVFLEGQVDLDFIESAFEKHNFKNYTIILVHCDDALRHKRLLHDRKQPELINADMDNWSQFLKKQATDKGITIVDSGVMGTDDMVISILERLFLGDTGFSNLRQ